MRATRDDMLVIFDCDCDCVLVDSERLVHRIEMKMIAELGWPITIEEMLDEHLGRTWPTVEANIERHIGQPVPPHFNDRRISATKELFERELAPIAGIPTAVATLIEGGYRTCVASSSAPWRIELVLGSPASSAPSQVASTAPPKFLTASPPPISFYMRLTK